MYKKLLGLLPLVWLAVLAQHHHGPEKPQLVQNQSADYGRKWPIIETRYSVFYHANPQVVPICLSPGGRTIKSITLEGSSTQSPRSKRGQLVEYYPILQSGVYQTVLLSPRSLERLPYGPQRLRFTMNDSSFADFYLIVAGDQPGASHPVPHNNALASKSTLPGQTASRASAPSLPGERRIAHCSRVGASSHHYPAGSGQTMASL